MKINLSIAGPLYQASAVKEMNGQDSVVAQAGEDSIKDALIWLVRRAHRNVHEMEQAIGATGLLTDFEIDAAVELETADEGEAW
jgi:hypothetical protein